MHSHPSSPLFEDKVSKRQHSFKIWILLSVNAEPYLPPFSLPHLSMTISQILISAGCSLIQIFSSIFTSMSAYITCRKRVGNFLLFRHLALTFLIENHPNLYVDIQFLIRFDSSQNTFSQLHSSWFSIILVSLSSSCFLQQQRKYEELLLLPLWHNRLLFQPCLWFGAYNRIRRFSFKKVQYSFFQREILIPSSITLTEKLCYVCIY